MTKVRNELEKVLDDGTTVADKLVRVLLEAALADPAKMWPFIREFVARDEGPIKTEISVTTDQAADFYSAISEMRGTVPRSPGEETQN